MKQQMRDDCEVVREDEEDEIMGNIREEEKEVTQSIRDTSSLPPSGGEKFAESLTRWEKQMKVTDR